MTAPADSLPLIQVVASLIIIIMWIWLKSAHMLGSKSRLKRSNKLFPPGPNPLPIIGNLLQLGESPHRSLTKLSETYGPLMHLKLGALHTIVVSSPEIAKQVLHTHDHMCSGRIVPDAVRALSHDERSIAWAQSGPRLNKLRRICKSEMFSISQLVSSEQLRMEKIKQMLEYLNECCVNNWAVNIGEVACVASLNMTSNTLFSFDLAGFDSGSSKEVIRLIHGLTTIASTPNLSDFFPILRRFDPQGIRRGAEECFTKFVDVIDEILSQRLRSSGASSSKRKDMLEALLEINRNDDSYLSLAEIKHLLVDLTIGGVDSTSNTIEWAMTELLRNPEKLSKAKDELRDVIGYDKAQVEESDISKLSYLNAVIKETLRLHPPGPFLVPHRAESDFEINGHTIPKNANIYFNIWAIGQDSRVWPNNPERFEPERFLESKIIDYRGQDFELIPFGSGRRMCPGLPLAHVSLHLMLASLIHRFDWKIDAEMRSQSLDVTEKFGLVLHKARPLMAFPIKC